LTAVKASKRTNSFHATVTAHNADISAIFRRLADLLEIEGANPFRIRAYRNAAQTIEDLPRSAAAMIAAGEDLTELPGIAADLAAKIEEITESGRLKLLDEVEARTPSTLAALTSIPGLGPKRIHTLHEVLGVTTIEELARAAKEQRIRGLPRFSAKLEARIAEEAAKYTQSERRFKIATAEDFAEALCAFLKTGPGIGNVIVAGSYRRRKDTVGDLDILATCDHGPDAIKHFVGYEEAAKIVSHGDTRSTIMLKASIQVDLRVVPKESYGAALHYFTGSKDHNIAVRRLGQAKGLKINEYGIFRADKRIGGKSEEEVLAAAGLPFIEPELRENRGEIEAGLLGRLPKLVALNDIKGDLHVHTKASDGKNTLREMAEAAKALGYAYIAITDHTQHATVARGLDAARLRAQLDEIDRLNDQLDGIVVLKSSEVDILADGSLDLPDSILKRLDFTVCSVHYKFDLDAKGQTGRILRAMDNRYCTIIAHPTGRLLGERPGYPVDLMRVMEGAKARGCFLELNAHPSRLDLDDIHCKQAKELGLKLSIGTDAHSTAGLNAMRFGIGQARRGWLEKDDVLNTRSWPQLRKFFSR